MVDSCSETWIWVCGDVYGEGVTLHFFRDKNAFNVMWEDTKISGTHNLLAFQSTDFVLS